MERHGTSLLERHCYIGTSLERHWNVICDKGVSEKVERVERHLLLYRIYILYIKGIEIVDICIASGD
jgi:hypothetical protein